MLFAFLGRIRRRHQCGMFLAVQQNINNKTEGERNSEKTVDFTKTLIGWFDWYDHREHPIEAGDAFCEDITTEDSKLKRLNSSHTAGRRERKIMNLSVIVCHSSCTRLVAFIFCEGCSISKLLAYARVKFSRCNRLHYSYYRFSALNEHSIARFLALV